MSGEEKQLVLNLSFFSEVKLPSLPNWTNPYDEERQFLLNCTSEKKIYTLISDIEKFLLEQYEVNISIVGLFILKSGCHLTILPTQQTLGGLSFNNNEKLKILADVHMVSKATSTDNHSDDIDMEVEDQAIPVTILTGFLGAGKTTLLNHFLKEQTEKKIAVIENEFGEIAIDKYLLEENSKISAAEQIVVMDNGCMCCTVRSDLLGAFRSISDKLKESGKNSIDCVLIETTGMANPVPIVRTIHTTPLIKEMFKMNNVVTLVDAKNILKRLEELEREVDEHFKYEDDEAFQQILFADKIIISKIDLVPFETVVKVWNRIRQINKQAPIIGSVHGQVQPAELFSQGAEKNIDELEIVETVRRNSCSNCDEDGHEHHDHSHSSTDSNHNKYVSTFSIVNDCRVDPLKFLWWLRKLATIKPELGLLYRAKGVLAVHGTARKLVFHAVCDVLDYYYLPESNSWKEGEPVSNSLVFIGKKLNEGWFREQFERCIFDNNKEITVNLEDYDAGDEEVEAAIHTMDHKLKNFSKYFTLDEFATYVQYMRSANLTVIPYKGLRFENKEQIEAAVVTWIEVSDLQDSATSNYVVDFTWRRETMDTFFSDPTNNTTSAMVKIDKQFVDEFGDDSWDSIKFKLRLEAVDDDNATSNTVTEAQTPESKNEEQQILLQQPSITNHRMIIQIIGGKTSSQVYQLSMHTIHPTYQVHVKVEDHRMPIIKTKETFHAYHPLMDALNKELRIRMLIRVKPDGSGLLPDMCGCC